MKLSIENFHSEGGKEDHKGFIVQVFHKSNPYNFPAT